MNETPTPTQQEKPNACFISPRGATWQQRKRLLRVQAWIVILASYPLLAFAYALPHDFRDESTAWAILSWTAFCIRTFVYHLGILLFAVIAIAAWRRCRNLVVAGLPVLLVAVGPTWWQYRPHATPTISGETLTVMSVNLLAHNRRTDPIIGEIKTARPDILFLQEYSGPWHAAIDDAVGADYPHKAVIRRDDSFGAAIYSRRPFKGRIERWVDLGSGSEPQMRVVVEIDGRNVALYNIHFRPPRPRDYRIETRKQFADLLEHIAAETLPVIVVGDFNFTERSPQAAALRALGVSEAHDLGGWGRGTTWPVLGAARWLPGLRIDHIYLTGGFTCTGCRTGQGLGSDHRPVIATIGFAR